MHHIYNKSIHRFIIFNGPDEYDRMWKLFEYYQYTGQPLRFSEYVRQYQVKKQGFNDIIQRERKSWRQIVDIIAFCLMPTHIHLILKQLHDNGIEQFMANCLNAYTRYFNLRHNRKGPLWEHRFGNTPIENEEHLAKAIDYVLTNPVKDNLVNHPSQWNYSSYNRYTPPGCVSGYLKSRESVQ